MYGNPKSSAVSKGAIITAWLLSLVSVIGSANAQDLSVDEAGLPRVLRETTRTAKTTLGDQLLVEPKTFDRPPLFEPIDEESYIVGPGDVFFVSAGLENFSTPVGPDGNLIVESVPVIYVTGKPLSEVKKLIKARVSRYYKSAEVHVALTTSKSFLVSITGAINLPGFYELKPGSRLSDLVTLAGGLSPRSSHMAVVSGASGQEQSVDMAAYFRDGNLSGNPSLQQGDRVLLKEVDFEAGIVHVLESRKIRAVQINPGDNLHTVLARAGDFEKPYEWDFVNVYDGQNLLQVVRRSEAGKYSPQNGTVLEVQSTKLQVFIDGSVLVPGAVDYNSSYTALDYMAVAGITVSTGDVSKIRILNSKGERRMVDPGKDIPRPGDHIFVPRSYEARVRDYSALMATISSLAVAIATFMVLTQ